MNTSINNTQVVALKIKPSTVLL